MYAIRSPSRKLACSGTGSGDSQASGVQNWPAGTLPEPSDATRRGSMAPPRCRRSRSGSELDGYGWLVLTLNLIWPLGVNAYSVFVPLAIASLSLPISKPVA